MFNDMGITQWRERNGRPIIKNYWTNNSKVSFDYLYNKISVFTSFFGQITAQLTRTKQQAVDLIGVLKKEYELK